MPLSRTVAPYSSANREPDQPIRERRRHPPPFIPVTNPIESSFSPVRARTRVTKGPGTKDTGLAMVFKLLQAAEGRWRAVNGPHLVALVRAGPRFEAGKLIERPDETPDKEADEDLTKVAA
jgi:hypothetical protein